MLLEIYNGRIYPTDYFQGEVVKATLNDVLPR